jgi:general secretion pathway protein D
MLPALHAALRRCVCRPARTAGLLAAIAVGVLGGCNPADQWPPPEAGIQSPTTISQSPIARSSSAGGTGTPVALNFGANTNRAFGSPEVVLGTGTFVGPSRSPPGPQVTTVGDAVTLDFSNVDIRDVLKNVLGDLLKVSYTVDPAVQGTITLQTGRPIPRTSIVDVLETTLQLSGVALVARNGLYVAVPIANAPRQAPIGGTSGFVTRVVPLQYVTAADLERALEPLTPPGAQIKSDAIRNILIVSGSDSDVRSIVNNIATFDVDMLHGLSFALLPLRNAKAREIANDVTNMLKSSGRSIADMVKINPIDRMNAVLVTSMQPAYLERVRGLVERFDRGAGGAEQQLFVYRVQNGRATDLARVLRRALGIESANGGGGQGAQSEATSPDNSGGSAPSAGAPPSGLDISQGSVSGNPPASAAPPGSPQLQSDALASVTTAANPLTGAAGAMTTGIRVTADPTNNALIVTATPQEYAPIEAALAQLDIPPLQVLVDATVAEVTLSNELDLGLQYFVNSGRFHAIFSPNTLNSNPAQQSSFFPNLNLPGLNILPFSAAYGTLDSHVVLQALSTLTTLRVLSSPNLLVLNNGTARLQVGDQVPIASQSSTSNLAPGAPTVNSINYKDTGVILNVTPRVNASGLVLLDISEEVSQAGSTSTSSLNSPTIAQRRVTSSLAVKDGQTIALAGLITDSRLNTKSGLPWLQELPIIGWLFGVRQDKATRTELLVLITPHVIRDRDEGDAVTAELQRKLRLTIPIVARQRQ